MRSRTLFTLALSTALLGSAALAQQPDGGSPPPPRGPRPGMGMMDHGGGDRDHGDRGGRGGGMRGGGFRILPPGIWWRNPDLIQKLTLSADQQKRMDDIFQQSRIQLVHIKAGLEEQQILLEPMLNANPLDSAKTMAQIDHIADTRAELEKANAKMLLGIRGVLTPDQWTKLQTEGRENRRKMWRERARGDHGHGDAEGMVAPATSTGLHSADASPMDSSAAPLL
jgi:Spy/CpxP family protein refolding chaperone